MCWCCWCCGGLGGVPSGPDDVEGSGYGGDMRNGCSFAGGGGGGTNGSSIYGGGGRMTRGGGGGRGGGFGRDSHFTLTGKHVRDFVCVYRMCT